MKKSWIIISIIVIAFLLRFVSLDKFPYGLNADEAALGYNAYSLIETGKDEHGASWPLVFRSFDDYKPPLYVYLTIPFLKVMGLNIWSVRLPSAIAGVLSVYILYLLVKNLFPNKKLLPEISAFILAISPWHIHFSRGAWEVNVSTFLVLLGTYLFIKSLKKQKYFIFFVLSFALSLYTYHSARIIAPLIALSLFAVYFKQLFNKNFQKTLIVGVIIGVLASLPIAFQLLSKEGQSRFSGVSIFADTGPLAWVEEMRRIDPNPNSLLTKIKYNRYSAYAGKYISNYFSHFSPNFLFINGDVIDRSRVPGFGQMLSILSPLLVLGLISSLLKISQPSTIFLLWLLIAPLAASLTYQSPHALRAENMIIPLSFFAAQGVYYLIHLFENKVYIKYTFIFSFALALLFQLNSYLYSYFVIYPKEIPIAWQYGFDELIKYTDSVSSKYNKIVISTRYDQPYILAAFYLKYPPAKLQKELVMSGRDNFGFSTGTSFGQYEFRKIDIDNELKAKNNLVVIADEPVKNAKVIKDVKSIGGQEIFKIVSTNVK